MIIYVDLHGEENGVEADIEILLVKHLDKLLADNALDPKIMSLIKGLAGIQDHPRMV